MSPVNLLTNQIFPALIDMLGKDKENLSARYCKLYNCMQQGLSITQGLSTLSGDLTQSLSIKIMNLYCTSLKAHELKPRGE